VRLSVAMQVHHFKVSDKPMATDSKRVDCKTGEE
jgi:hypothetical protein